MRWCIRLACGVISIIWMVAFLLTMYVLGKDICIFMPEWLPFFIVGFVSFTFFGVIVTVFVTGVPYIIGWFRGG